MWQPGEIIATRGIFRNKVWSALPTIVVRDCSDELAIALLPGAECLVEKTYTLGKKAANRLWDFTVNDWTLAPFVWHTNRVVILHEPGKFHSVWLFWQEDNNEFGGYYVNFQLPIKRSVCGIDTLDLELDLDIHPDFSSSWKDEDEFQKAIKSGLILPEWIQAIEEETPEILDKLEKRQYPFDDSWLHWTPPSHWAAPRLPENWDQIEQRTHPNQISFS